MMQDRLVELLQPFCTTATGQQLLQDMCDRLEVNNDDKNNIRNAVVTDGDARGIAVIISKIIDNVLRDPSVEIQPRPLDVHTAEIKGMLASRFASCLVHRQGAKHVQHQLRKLVADMFMCFRDWTKGTVLARFICLELVLHLTIKSTVFIVNLLDNELFWKSRGDQNPFTGRQWQHAQFMDNIFHIAATELKHRIKKVYSICSKTQHKTIPDENMDTLRKAAVLLMLGGDALDAQEKLKKWFSNNKQQHKTRYLPKSLITTWLQPDTNEGRMFLHWLVFIFPSSEIDVHAYMLKRHNLLSTLKQMSA